jgi:hypothetical protein
MARKPRTLLEVCAALAGGRLRDAPKATRVATYIVQWAIAARELDGEPTAERVCEWWGENERTHFRRLAEFRELFGAHLGDDLATPQSIAVSLPELPPRDNVIAGVSLPVDLPALGIAA